MTHPLVIQLRFARSEFVRCLEGITEKEAQLGFELVGVPRVLGEQQHRPIRSGRDLGDQQGSAGADQPPPGRRPARGRQRRCRGRKQSCIQGRVGRWPVGTRLLHTAREKQAKKSPGESGPGSVLFLASA